MDLSGRFAVIDVETTGLDPVSDAVVSVGLVVVADGRIDDSATMEILVNPDRPIPVESTALHGLTNADVATAGNLRAALEVLAPELHRAVVVGHHLPFDLAFLGLAPERTVDTRVISRLLWPGRDHRHTLDHLAGRLGIPIVNRHTASGDARLTAQVLLECAPLLANRGLTDSQAIARAYCRQRHHRAQISRSNRRRRLRGPRRYSSLARRNNCRLSRRCRCGQSRRRPLAGTRHRSASANGRL